MKARLFDEFGLHIHTVRDVGDEPPEYWHWADIQVFRERFEVALWAPVDAPPYSATVRRFRLVAVNFDATGTWARYEVLT